MVHGEDQLATSRAGQHQTRIGSKTPVYITCRSLAAAFSWCCALSMPASSRAPASWILASRLRPTQASTDICIHAARQNNLKKHRSRASTLAI